MDEDNWSWKHKDSRSGKQSSGHQESINFETCSILNVFEIFLDWDETEPGARLGCTCDVTKIYSFIYLNGVHKSQNLTACMHSLCVWKWENYLYERIKTDFDKRIIMFCHIIQCRNSDLKEAICLDKLNVHYSEFLKSFIGH